MPLPLAFLLALALCLANDLLDHYHAPYGILLGPAVLVLSTLLLNWRRPARQLVPAAVATALLSCLHQAGLQLYGGGDHDGPGLGALTALLVIGTLASWLLLLLLVSRAIGASWRTRLTAVLVLPLLVGSYLYFFWEMGLGRFY